MPERGAHIFLGGMIDRTVAVELASDLDINRRVVGHDVGSAIDVAYDDRAQRLGADVGNMERANRAIAKARQSPPKGDDNGCLGSPTLMATLHIIPEDNRQHVNPLMYIAAGKAPECWCKPQLREDGAVVHNSSIGADTHAEWIAMNREFD